MTVQSYLVLEKNRNVSGNLSYTDTDSEEEYRPEAAFNEIPGEALSIFQMPFHLQTTQISRITTSQMHLL